LAEPGDIADDATIWFGAMLPLSGRRGEAFGRMNANALDLGRRDFHQIAGGLPRTDARGRARPMGIVLCDDMLDPREEARHLVEEVGVPAVVGFHQSEEAIDLATSFFLPHHVIVLSTLNQSPLVTKVPQPAGEPRLLWRTTADSNSWAAPVAQVVASIAEPAVRAEPSRRARPIRFTFVRGDKTMSHNAATLSFAGALLERLRFNGMSAIANGDNYREVFAGERPADTETIDTKRIVRELLEAPPDIVFANNDILAEIAAPLEARWPSGRGRPFYIAMTGDPKPGLLRFFGSDAGRRHRFLAVELAVGATPNVLLSRRYNEYFSPPIAPTFTPASAYDAFYVLAYSAFAAGDGDLDGLRLAKAMGRLSQGPVVDVGPTGIFDAIGALANGGSIDLNGAGSSLDFDPATGETSSAWDVLCIGGGKSGAPRSLVPSGIVYRPGSKTLEGRMACP
jgi:hypothetical protein